MKRPKNMRGPSPKYTAEQVRQWRKGARAGVSVRALAKAHGIPQGTMAQVLAGRTYKWVR